MKKHMKTLASLSLAASIMATGMPFEKAEATSAVQGKISINATNLYLRSDDNFNARPIKVLHKGESYNVYAQSNGMYNLGGNQWVTASSKYVTYTKSATPQPTATTPTATVSNGTVTVKVSSLNVRNDASFSAKIVGIATKGQSFTILEQRNGLYRIGAGKWITATSTYVSTSASKPTTVSVTPKTPVAAPVSNAQQLINFGKQFMGMPYVWASSNPNNGGFDCSGFIYYVFKNNGYNISRLNVEGYWNTVQRLSTPQVGDLVFFKNTYRTGPSHIGIYIGNGQFLNANSSRGISIDNLSNPYYSSHFLGYGRFK